MVCADSTDVSSWCEYGDRFTASVQRGHIYGTQFHPEKSQTLGLRLIANFLKWRP
jgi:glutamine amidotransferase